MNELAAIMSRSAFLPHRLHLIYREKGLTVRRRGGRKCAIGTRSSMATPQGPNQWWSPDFMSDTLSDGHRFRML